MALAMNCREQPVVMESHQIETADNMVEEPLEYLNRIKIILLLITIFEMCKKC